MADSTRKKRLLLASVTSGIVFACGIVFLWIGSVPVWTSRIVQGALAAAIAPALTSITLGLVGQEGLPARLGLNQAWNHFGNCSTALLGGLVGYYYGIPGVFVVLALMGGLVVLCLARINPRQINYAVARGLDERQEGEKMTPARELFASPAVLAVGVTLFFFHLGNAAMLPLLGQSAVARFDVDPAVYTAATIFIAQTTMIVTALWGAKQARLRGYGLLFIIALLALPLRGIIAGCFDSSWNIIPVQMLDGVGAGLIGVATPGIVARLLKGTGHINMGLGFVLTVQGVGAALSSSYGGLFAHHISYQVSFIALAAAPCFGLALFVMAVRRYPLLTRAAASHSA
ncbi:MAG: putative MFS-type transporter [Desulfovibrio sp.]